MRLHQLCLLLIFSSVWLAGCRENREIERVGVVYCVDASFKELNPQLYGSSPIGSALSNQLYDRLITIDPVNQRFEGQLARKWSISRDGLHYIFYLQKGISFHSTPWFKPTRTLNADDVLFSFNRILDPLSPYHTISGGQYPFFDSIQFNEQVAAINKLDNETIEFVLKKPNAAFLAAIASDSAVILSAEYGANLLSENKPEQLDRQIIGTGPYLLAETRNNEFIRMHANTDYRNGPPSVQRLVFDYTPKPTNRLAKLLTGECQIMAAPAAAQLSFIKNNSQLTLEQTNTPNTAYLAINTQRNAFSDVTIRQALSSAINREQIISAVYYDTGESTTTLLPPESWAYNPNLPEAPYEPISAKMQLKNHPAAPTRMELLVPTTTQTYNPNPVKLAQLLKADLSQIGVDVKIVALNNYWLRKRIMTNNYDAILTGWSAETTDPDSFLRPILSCGASMERNFNYTRWCNDHFEQLMDRAIGTNNMARRIDAYQEAQQLLADELPLIPIARAVNIYATRTSLHNVGHTLMGGLIFKQAYRD
jgi:ABC-type dipeptide transport system, periplasmic component